MAPQEPIDQDAVDPGGMQGPDPVDPGGSAAADPGGSGALEAPDPADPPADPPLAPPQDPGLAAAVAAFEAGDYVTARARLNAAMPAGADDARHAARLQRALAWDPAPWVVAGLMALSWLYVAWQTLA